MQIKVFYSQSYNGWGFGESQAIMNLVNTHYDAPDHLKLENINDIQMPCFVIYDNDECSSSDIIGVSFFKPITKHLVRTYRTVLHPDHRGKGVGTKLNEFMEREFKRKKFKKIACNVYVDNKPSLALKLKMGYIIEGTLRDHDFPGKHEYALGKFL